MAPAPVDTQSQASDETETRSIALCPDQAQWLSARCNLTEDSPSDVDEKAINLLQLSDAAQRMIEVANRESPQVKRQIFLVVRCYRCLQHTRGGDKYNYEVALPAQQWKWLEVVRNRSNHATIGKTIRIMVDFYKPLCDRDAKVESAIFGPMRQQLEASTSEAEESSSSSSASSSDVEADGSPKNPKNPENFQQSGGRKEEQEEQQQQQQQLKEEDKDGNSKGVEEPELTSTTSEVKIVKETSSSIEVSTTAAATAAANKEEIRAEGQDELEKQTTHKKEEEEEEEEGKQEEGKRHEEGEEEAAEAEEAASACLNEVVVVHEEVTTTSTSITLEGNADDVENRAELAAAGVLFAEHEVELLDLEEVEAKA
mmetsp:Transcript_67547/g.147078  ORF Transcript_67547/g.147078 Transcript_67547/m.147078 type:complete len:370 (-) Transcript_67547:373-1482(-)